MENRQYNGPTPRKKRGRPAGTHITPAFPSETKTSIKQEPQDVKSIPNHAFTEIQAQHTHAPTGIAKEQAPLIQTRVSSAFSQLLRSIFHQDRNELLRVAQELDVSENSIYRWMSGNTEPRLHHLKRLPKILPAYQEELIEAINTTFHNILKLQSKSTDGVIGEVPKEIYRRIIDLITTIDEPDARFWEISQALFAHALFHLDREQQGMAITYAPLLPPHHDGIHAMREAAMRGHEPWPFHLQDKVYLGSTSLAGMAATLQRMQIWDEKESERLQVEIDEHERSACAVPIVRGSRIAGVLIVSSTNAHFFHQPIACQAISEYAQLLALALREHDFQPFSLLHLRPMPALSWQRTYLAHYAITMIVNYARKHHCSRQEAEYAIEQEIENEFERVGQEQQRSKTVQPNTQTYPLSPFGKTFIHHITGQS
jgi:hypothetical protein